MRRGILLSDDLSLQVSNRSLRIGDVSGQNQKLLIITDKGEVKKQVTQGVGARRYVEMNSQNELARETRLQLIADGFTVNQIRIENAKLMIDANY